MKGLKEKYGVKDYGGRSCNSAVVIYKKSTKRTPIVIRESRQVLDNL